MRVKFNQGVGEESIVVVSPPHLQGPSPGGGYAFLIKHHQRMLDMTLGHNSIAHVFHSASVFPILLDICCASLYFQPQVFI
jgi:hypothetical protein